MQPARSTASTASTAPVQPPVLALPIAALARFRRLMNYEGWDVDLARMCTDRPYAYQCLATAHTSNDDRLRSAALQLFAAYDRNPDLLH